MSLNLTFALQKRILSLVLVIVLLCGMVAPLPSVHAAGGPYLVDANAKAMNFNLNKADLLSGSGKNQGTAYRYHNVIPDSATPVDAIVTISKLGSKASLGKFDDEGSNSNRFQPVLTTTGTAEADESSGNNSVEYTVEFKSGSIDGEEYSNDDVYIKDFYLTVIDIDGSSATNTEFVEISGYESFTIHKDNALKDKGIYSQTTGRTRFTGINTSLVSPSGGPEFDNTGSFIANYTVPVHSMKLVIGNTRNLGDRQFSLNFGEPGGVYTDPKPPVPNSATVDIDVQIADGGDGYLTSSELGSVTVSGQTDAPQGQLVFISLKDNAQGTPHSADYMATVDTDHKYTVQADLSFFTGTVTATASVIDSLGNPGTAKATTAVNNMPVASIVSIQGNAVVGGTVTGQYTLTDAENDAGAGAGSVQDLSTYKWYMGSVQDGSDKVLINSQTGKTYTIQNGDFGQYLFFEVTPKAAAGLNPGAAVTSLGIKVTKKPVADAQTVQAYADVPVTITLTGSDEDLPVTQLVYTKGAANVQYGTLTPVVGSDNMQWRYIANTESVTDSFTFTVTDSDDNVSAPATVTIKVNKSLDGWVGDSQGITQPVKAAAGQLLKISAVSSVEADEVTAKVDSTAIPAIPLTLVNTGTYITDGFKQWMNTGFTVPADTPAASYHVSFTAEKDNISLPDEPVSKLANNDFDVAAAPIANGVEKSADKGQEVSFTQADFTGQFTDSQHNSAGLIKVKISDLPVQGLLLLNNIPVSEGDEIDAANLGQLTFVPEPGQTGTVTFTWNGYDGLQYAAAGNHVTIKINNPPVVGDIQKTGLAGAVIPFASADFTGAFTDTDPGNTLEKVKISLPGDFASKGKLWYTPVTTAVYVNPGSFAEIDAADLASLKFEPVENLPAETLVSFKWEGQDGRQYSENQGNITITYNGKPIAIPQTVKLNEGTASISIVLKGMDAETVTGLVYGIQSQPSKGSLSPAGGDTWIYTPDPGFTGEDSFSFTVTDGDHQVSLPVNVTIHVIKQLDGWVGDKAQGDPTVIKGMPGQPLKLSAVSSVEADEVVATVDGTTVPLSLTNGLTYQTDGFKRWEAVEFVLPLTTAPQTYQVTFEAKREGNSLQTEEQTKLGDNRFEVIGVGLNLSANPAKIIGDGKSTTSLTAVLTDKDGKPIAGVEVVFSVPAGAGNGSFPDSDRAVTDAQGKATVLYQSSKITGTAEKKIPVTATVNDPARGLYAQDQIMVTFQPASVSGIITKGGSNEPVPNATVRITLDLNNDGKIEPGVDFDETVQTDANGAYSIIVPKGDVQYELEVTQTVTVGNVQAPVTYKQKAYVGEVTGVGNEDFDSEKTVSGIVLFKQADGQSKMIDNAMVSKTKVYLKDAAGNYIMENGSKKAFELQDSGAFSATGLALGDYTLEISYEVAPGQELVISRGNVSVKANGEMNISEELVDPYGTVTDAATNATIEGAKVTLYYADTQRNKDNGRTPYAGVVLPAIADFEPNYNASPVQLTNNGGLYAYMVFPHADYYLVVTKAGYQAYTSPTIPVETDIVKHDIKMNRVKKSSGGSSSSTPASDPAVSLNISTDKNLVKEGDNSTLNIDYKNGSANTLPSGEIKVTLPDGITIVDAAGGKVNGNVITWSVTDLGGGQSGSRTVIIKWPQIDAQGKSFNVSGEFVAGNNAAAPVQAQSEVKVQVFSDRFGELSHQRYILGYPDGMFKPDRSLSRAELAAIVARLTENDELTDPLNYTDVKADHWAANYIRIVTKHGYFNGFEDGTFRPEAPVTRGELVAVMARFLKLNVSTPNELHFNDIEGHWAAASIEELYRSKYLAGYPDGSFKPQNNIIRSEAVTLVNRMLYRGPLKGLNPLFPDVNASHWAFGDVQEATISHEANRNADGSEAWQKNIEDKVR